MHAVSALGLRKDFGPVRAVDDVTLEIPEGQVVALLGPNGAGKTTTVDLLLGLAKPDIGRVAIFGRAPRAALDAGDIGAVLQTGALVAGARVGELLRAIAALYRHPVPLPTVVAQAGLEGLLGRRTEKLSGGETQRVRFALALVGGARLLVLDEPTAGLDVTARARFWQAVRAGCAAGQTVLFSTHYLDEADEHADRIVVLNQGRVVADGPATAIRAIAANRVIRCTLPGADCDRIAALPGVVDVERHGDTLAIRSDDTDVTLRALLLDQADARDLEVRTPALADAFTALTAEPIAVGAGR
jgi:ABC-2 type transport system ATP-binding protein